MKIEQDGDEWVVCDWVQTPQGLLWAGLKWFSSHKEAWEYCWECHDNL